jgi:hypothetical protein
MENTGVSESGYCYRLGGGSESCDFEINDILMSSGENDSPLKNMPVSEQYCPQTTLQYKNNKSTSNSGSTLSLESTPSTSSLSKQPDQLKHSDESVKSVQSLQSFFAHHIHNREVQFEQMRNQMDTLKDQIKESCSYNQKLKSQLGLCLETSSLEFLPKVNDSNINQITENIIDDSIADCSNEVDIVNLRIEI